MQRAQRAIILCHGDVEGAVLLAISNQDLETLAAYEERSVAQQLMAGQNLDLDSMSYEQLLALGEVVGDVKIGVNEDMLPEVCEVKRLQTVDIAQLQSTTVEALSSDIDYDGRCSICLESYCKGDNLATLITCDHRFHYACLSRWLQDSKKCPLCFQEVDNSFRKQPSSQQEAASRDEENSELFNMLVATTAPLPEQSLVLPAPH